MVVDQVEDLDISPVGQPPMGGVGLPELIGQLGLEAVPGRLGTLVGLGGDEALGLEDSPDGLTRRRTAQSHGEVVGDGLSAGVDTEPDQLLAQLDDDLLDFSRSPSRRRLGTP